MKSIFSGMIVLVSLSVVHAGTVMGDSMKKMEEACKQLGPDLKQTDDTKHDKAADLQSVATIKEQCTKSRAETPKKAQSLPPDQLAKMEGDFQRDMDTFIQHADVLAADIQADKWDAARTDFQNLMKEQHDDHHLYRVKK